MFLKEAAFKNIDVIHDSTIAGIDKVNLSQLFKGYDPITKSIIDFVHIAAIKGVPLKQLWRKAEILL